MGHLLKLDSYLSTLLCSGALEIEGFDLPVTERRRSGLEWRALFACRVVPSMQEVFEILRDTTRCTIFTLRMGLGASDQWEVFRFEVCCPSRFDIFFVYPNGNLFLVQFSSGGDAPRMISFNDVNKFILSIEQWFSDAAISQQIQRLEC